MLFLAALLIAAGPLHVEDYVKKEDGADFSPAFQRLLAAPECNPAVNARVGCKIELGCNTTYPISAPIDICRQVVMQGCSGSGWGAGTVLAPLRGNAGIVLRGNYECTKANRGAGAEWSKISDLAIVYRASPSVTIAHAIQAEAKCSIQDVYIKGATGDGVNILGDVAAPGVHRNANMWNMSNVLVSACDGSGIYVTGGDASGGTATAVNVGSNCKAKRPGCAGIVDNSFLGNTWVGPASSTNQTCALFLNDSQRSVILGLYCESDQNPPFLAQSDVALGGLSNFEGPGVQIIAIGRGGGVRLGPPPLPRTSP